MVSSEFGGSMQIFYRYTNMKKILAGILFALVLTCVFGQPVSDGVFKSEIINKSYYKIQIDDEEILPGEKKNHIFSLRSGGLYDGRDVSYLVPFTEKIYYEHKGKFFVANNQKTVLIENPDTINSSETFVILKNSSQKTVELSDGKESILEHCKEGKVNGFRNEWSGGGDNYIIPNTTVVYDFSMGTRVCVKCDTELELISRKEAKKGYVYEFEFTGNAVKRIDARPIIKMFEPTWEFPFSDDVSINAMEYDKTTKKIFLAGNESGKAFIQSIDDKMNVNEFDDKLSDADFTNLAVLEDYIVVVGKEIMTEQYFLLKYTKDGEKIGQAFKLSEGETVSDVIATRKDTFLLSLIDSNKRKISIHPMKLGKKITKQKALFDKECEDLEDTIISTKIIYDSQNEFVWLAINYDENSNSYSEIYKISINDGIFTKAESSVDLVEISSLSLSESFDLYFAGTKANKRNSILKIQNAELAQIEEIYTPLEKNMSIFDVRIENQNELVFCGGKKKASSTQPTAPFIRCINMKNPKVLAWDNELAGKTGNITMIQSYGDYGFVTVVELPRDKTFSIVRLNDCGQISESHQKFESSVKITSNVDGELFLNGIANKKVEKGGNYMLSLIPQKYEFQVRGESGNLIFQDEITLTGNSSKTIVLKDDSKLYEVKKSSEISYSIDGKILKISGEGELNKTPWISNEVSASDIEIVKIGEGIISIGEGIFSGYSNLSSVELPDSLETIGKRAFYNCSHLTDMQMKNKIKEIGEEAFYKCNALESINIPESVDKIEMNAFMDCLKLREIIVSDLNKNYKSIGGILYLKDETELILCPAENKLNVFSIPESVQKIHANAFANQKYVVEILIGKNVEDIGSNAFFNCQKLERFTVSGGNKSFKAKDSVLYNSALSRLINYPRMKSDESFTVMSSVNLIEEYAFYSPTYLRTLFFEKETVPDIKKQNWAKTDFEIIVPNESLNNYRSHESLGDVSENQILSKRDYENRNWKLKEKKEKQIRNEVKAKKFSEFMIPYEGWFSIEAGIYYDYTKFNPSVGESFPGDFNLAQPRFGVKLNPAVFTFWYFELLPSLSWALIKTSSFGDELTYNELDYSLMLGFNFWERRISLRAGLGFGHLWESVKFQNGEDGGTNQRQIPFVVPVDFEFRICKIMSVVAEYKYAMHQDLDKHSFNIGLIFNTAF